MRRLVIFLAVALALLVVAGRPVSAQPTPYDQTDPDITAIGNGQFLLVWSEDRGAGHQIYAKRVRSNGLPVGGASGGEWAVAGSTGPAGQKGEQRWPAVSEGLLVWSELVPGGTDYDLYAQRLRGNGRTFGAPKLLVGGPGDQVHPDIEGDIVVWSEDTNDAGDIMGLRITTALAPRGAPFEVAKGPGTAEDPVISRDVSDPRYLLVLWTDDRNGNKDIYGTRVVDSGLPRGGPLGGQFPVIERPEDDYAPTLVFGAFDRNARTLLAWTTDDVTDGPNVMAQRLRSNGYPVGSAFTIAGGAGAQGWPAATFGEGNEWFAVWTTDETGNLDVMGVELLFNGLSRRRPRTLAGD